jgi:predicted P-loop ATPase
VRKSYGKHDTTKPALCSLVGTVNNAGGFLNDETGNRRFLVTTITRLDWAYESLPIDQVWAQAVALYQAGEPWRLTEEEAAHQERQNQEYDVETPLEGWIAHFFEFTGRDEHRITLADVYDRLAERVRQTQKTDNEISRVLRKFGAERKRTGKARFYSGVHQRERVSGSTSDSLVTLSDTILSQADCPPQSDKRCDSDSSDTINGKTPKNEPEPESGDFSESVADKVSQVSPDATNGTTEPQEEVTHGVTDCHQDTVTAPEPSASGAAAPPDAAQGAAPAADGAAPDPAPPEPEHDAALISACGPMAADTRARIAQARQNWRNSESAFSQLCRVLGWDVADAIRAWVEAEKMVRAQAREREGGAT